MKVLMLNTFDEIGGAARAATRLLAGLRTRGIDAQLLVHDKTGCDETILCPAGAFRQQARRLKMLLGSMPVRCYPKAPAFNFTPAQLPDHLRPEITAIDPDIVHLHWLGAGFLRIETLAQINRPLLWTLHDSWVFTGGCHVPFDCTRYRQQCGHCPVLGSAKEDDLSRRVWQRKRQHWQDLDLTLVAPSRWLADAASASSLFHDARIEVIPNGLDTDQFQPGDKAAARHQLDLPQDKQIILFGAIRAVADPNKGLQHLVPALQRLGQEKANLMAVAFNAYDQDTPPDVGMPLHFLGHVRDDRRLAALYRAADLFVVPSLQEAFCQTAVEAMSCGTPVVAFAASGLLDVVDHQHNGYLATPYDPASLADGMVWVLADRPRYQQLTRAARQKVTTHFAIGEVARRYTTLYEDICRNGPHERSRP
jgi:glycosyltransferase involved in cell wall biosynthesis